MLRNYLFHHSRHVGGAQILSVWLYSGVGGGLVVGADILPAALRRRGRCSGAICGGGLAPEVRRGRCGHCRRPGRRRCCHRCCRTRNHRQSHRSVRILQQHAHLLRFIIRRHGAASTAQTRGCARDPCIMLLWYVMKCDYVLHVLRLAGGAQLCSLRRHCTLRNSAPPSRHPQAL